MTNESLILGSRLRSEIHFGVTLKVYITIDWEGVISIVLVLEPRCTIDVETNLI